MTWRVLGHKAYSDFILTQEEDPIIIASATGNEPINDIALILSQSAPTKWTIIPPPVGK
jgi:hypothetical protein